MTSSLNPNEKPETPPERGPQISQKKSPSTLSVSRCMSTDDVDCHGDGVLEGVGSCDTNLRRVLAATTPYSTTHRCAHEIGSVHRRCKATVGRGPPHMVDVIWEQARLVAGAAGRGVEPLHPPGAVALLVSVVIRERAADEVWRLHGGQTAQQRLLFVDRADGYKTSQSEIGILNDNGSGWRGRCRTSASVQAIPPSLPPSPGGRRGP